ncbi:MAG: carbohydrate ABC transporter permease [Treponema sp.]|jgi:ABC-type glycerol-3-phosphate transport system permease component|nr:carbohydrate ABC transporter permease [Treponema sp.]
MRIKRYLSSIVINIILLFLLFLTLYPLYFSVITSFKDNEQFFKHFWSLPNPWIGINYIDAIRIILPYLGNSIIISVFSISIILLSASMSAYAFARLRFPGREIVFMALLALLMIPSLLTLIPQFVILRDLRLLVPAGIRPYIGIMLGYIAGQQAFSVFIIRAFFESQPEELFEAARIDGCNEFRAYFRIALPLIKPVLATVAIVTLLGIWNDYLWPLVVTTDPRYFTIALGLLQFRATFNVLILYGPMFAGYVVASLPLVVLYILLMRSFIEGLTAGAIKM